MANQPRHGPQSTVSQFQQSQLQMHGSAHVSSGPLREFWYYLRVRKKWWLTPVIVALLIVGMFVVLGGTVAAPLIYTLF